VRGGVWVGVEVPEDGSSHAHHPEDLDVLRANLVHNAIVHNLPEHGTVWVHTCVRNSKAVLIVENTGDKLASGLVATLAEPFQRGTNAFTPTARALPEASESPWDCPRAREAFTHGPDSSGSTEVQPRSPAR